MSVGPRPAAATYHEREHFSVVVAGDAAQAEHLEPAFFPFSKAQDRLMHFTSLVLNEILNDVLEDSIDDGNEQVFLAAAKIYLLDETIMRKCFVRKWHGLKEETDVRPPIVERRPKTSEDHHWHTFRTHFLPVHCLWRPAADRRVLDSIRV